MLLPLSTGNAATNRYIPARRAHSSKPAAEGLLLWAYAGTEMDKQTD